jgi:hypothetical protein
MKFKTNDTFFHAGYQGVVLAPVMTEGVFSGRYDVGWGPANLPMRLKEEWMFLEDGDQADKHTYSFNTQDKPNVIICDDFYSDPDSVRALALEQEYFGDLRYHKGERTKNKYLFPWVKEKIESILGAKIPEWTKHGYNGVFQYCPADTPIVYHADVQSYAAVVYLTPNAPYEAGTSLFASKKIKGYRRPAQEQDGLTKEEANSINDLIFGGNLLDKTAWELVDVIGNVYNRLAIWDSHLLHAASCYFGTELKNSRLFHMYFFDIEK